MNLDAGQLAQIDTSTPTGQVIGGGIGISALVWAFFHVKKMFRADKGEAGAAAGVALQAANVAKEGERTAANATKQDEREDKYLARIEARVVELEARADDAFAQRNVAIEDAAAEKARATIAEQALTREVGVVTKELNAIKESRQRTKVKLGELEVAIIQLELKLATAERDKRILIAALVIAHEKHDLILGADVAALLNPSRRSGDVDASPAIPSPKPQTPAPTDTSWSSGVPGDE